MYVLCYICMELNKNIYINSKNTDTNNSQNQRLRDIEWYNYDNNVKKIKIKLLELEKIKNLKVSAGNTQILEKINQAENNKDKDLVSLNILSDNKNENNIQKYTNNNDNNRKIIEEIFNNAEIELKEDDEKINIDNKNNDIVKNQNILNNKDSKKEKKQDDKKDNKPEEKIKVLPSQVKNPLEWLFTENYYFNKSLDDFGYILTSYVVGNVFGSWLGLFLVSTGLFPTIGMVIAIYAVIPKGFVMGVSQFFSRIVGMKLPLSNDYNNLTSYVVKYGKNAPKKVQNKVKAKESQLKQEIEREKMFQEAVKKYREGLQKNINSILPEINKKENARSNLIKLNNNDKKDIQKQNIINNNNKSIKIDANNIEDIKRLINSIKQEKEKNKNKEKELWLNKIDNQVKSDINRSLLLEKPQNNN